MTKHDALRYRLIIEQAAQSLDDATALEAVALYPKWQADLDYTSNANRPVGFKVLRKNKLYRLVQEHHSQTNWAPELAPTLWTSIDEIHDGTIDSPIPYSGNMILENGKYYVQDFVIYLCIRDTINPVYHPLSELIGIYVERI